MRAPREYLEEAILVLRSLEDLLEKNKRAGEGTNFESCYILCKEYVQLVEAAHVARKQCPNA